MGTKMTDPFTEGKPRRAIYGCCSPGASGSLSRTLRDARRCKTNRPRPKFMNILFMDPGAKGVAEQAAVDR